MKKNIVLLSEDPFPYGFAGSVKNRILTNALAEEGSNVRVLVIRPSDSLNPIKGKYNKVDFEYITKIKMLNKKSIKLFKIIFINNLLKKLIGAFLLLFNKIILMWCRIKSIFYLYKLNKKHGIDTLLIYTLRFGDIIFMRIASKITNTRLFMFLVEDYSTFKFRKFTQRFFASLYMNKSIYFIDGVLPISNYLYDFIEKIEKSRKKKTPKLIIPILYGNKNMYDCVVKEKKPINKYFLFNSSSGFIEDAEFVIKAFASTNNKVKKEYKLVLIIGDITENLVKALNYLVQSLNIVNSVIIKGYVSEKKLKLYYKKADALLIPLPDTDKSRARFSQKIGTFLLSGNPMITTNIGEIQNYFTDNENALIAASYNIKEYSEKMNYIFDYPEHSAIIGKNGQKFVLKTFDSSKYAKLLLRFCCENTLQ